MRKFAKGYYYVGQQTDLFSLQTGAVPYSTVFCELLKDVMIVHVVWTENKKRDISGMKIITPDSVKYV